MIVTKSKIIYDEFCKKNIEQLDSYGSYLKYKKLENEFLNKLPKNLHYAYNEIIEIENTCFAEQCEDYVRFVLSLLKELCDY